ncbi:PepSY-associated TM helix domain-containing protein [Leptolyngbya sp. AN03gr2]|uniref:PepSY-associated TM helix domain-containing protein n=1 Tax=Leptolyngbya sp. AN03gr2 TaxID=3423364 RepID=UPI003D310DBB
MAGLARRTWFVVHSWLGLTCGLLLFVVCWSGTIAVFSHEIDWLIDERIQARSAPDKLRWQKIEDAVKARYPGWRITEINAPIHDGAAVEVLAEPETDNPHRVYVDPATAVVIGHTSYLNVQRFFRSFHMALFDTGRFKFLGVPVGYLTVALLSFPLLASAIASLLFYRRWWRGFFSLSLNRGAKSFWSSAHKLVGVWSLWLIFAIGITGLWYLAEWYIPYDDPPEPAEQQYNRPPLALDHLVMIAQANYPGLRVTGMSNWEGEEIVSVDGRDGAFLVRDRAAGVSINRYTGAITDMRRPSDMGAVDRLMETVDPVHFGNWGGLWSKALYFFFGLGMTGLTLSGAYLQAKRQQTRFRPGRVRLPVLFAYLATLAACLFAILGAWHEIRGYGLAGQFPSVAWPTLVVIFMWCFSTIGALTIWMLKLR